MKEDKKLPGRVGVPPAAAGIQARQDASPGGRDAHPTQTNSCVVLSLSQPWLTVPDPGFQKTFATLHSSSKHLHLSVLLEDTNILSQSTAHNQSLHLLGDTLEIFLMLPGAADYLELHVSPHNHRTCLRWPLGAIEKVRAGEIPLEHFRQSPDTFTSRVQLQKNAWRADIDLPAAALALSFFAIAQKLHLSLCRYDYLNLETPPLLSTTAAHKIKNFHLYKDWPEIKLTPSHQQEAKS